MKTLFTVVDNYSFYGMYNNCMLMINDKSQTCNIRRNDIEGFDDYRPNMLANLDNFVGGGEAFDFDIYSSDSEERLVHYSDTATVAPIYGYRFVKATFTFNSKSLKYADKIIEEFKRAFDDNQVAKLISVNIEVVDTFFLSNKDLVELQNKYYLEYDIDKDTVSFLFPE